jgi:hypothetical protein
MTYTISIAPSRSPGKITAHSSDGHTRTFSTPLLHGARYWQATRRTLERHHRDGMVKRPRHWALRSTIGHAASLTVRDGRFEKAE